MENTNINQQNQPQQLTLKTCTKCKIQAPATTGYFYKNKSGKFGLTSRCKLCVNEDNKKWAKANPDRVKANANNRSKKYYHSNLDKSRKIARDSAAKARNDPKKKLKIQSRKRAGGAGLTPEQIDLIRSNQNNKCAICSTDNPTDLDHCHKTGNVRWLLCKHCNRGLGAFKDDPLLLRTAAQMLEDTKA